MIKIDWKQFVRDYLNIGGIHYVVWWIGNDSKSQWGINGRRYAHLNMGAPPPYKFAIVRWLDKHV